jgi:hypothetical protein
MTRGASARLAGVVALLLVAAACSSGGAGDGGNATTTSPPEQEVLSFTAPRLGGGTLDGEDYSGRDVAIWFWAPW